MCSYLCVARRKPIKGWIRAAHVEIDLADQHDIASTALITSDAERLKFQAHGYEQPVTATHEEVSPATAPNPLQHPTVPDEATDRLTPTSSACKLDLAESQTQQPQTSTNPNPNQHRVAEKRRYTAQIFGRDAATPSS